MTVELALVLLLIPVGILGILVNWIGPGGYFHTNWFFRTLRRLREWK